MRNRIKRRDKNQASIISDLRDCGLQVLDLSQVGDSCPDLLVSYHGTSYLVELKSDSGHKVTEGQRRFAEKWGAPVIVARSTEQLLAALHGLRRL